MMSAFNLKSALKRSAAFFRNDHGGAAIIMGLMTPIIIGGLAFGAEVGGWELTKRQVQNAADTAAFAAGTQVRSGEDLATITAAAAAVAQESGYDGGVAGVSVEYPPSTAPLAADGTDPNGDNRFVYVELTQTDDRLFTKYFSNGSNTITFNSSALARVENGRPACVLALHPSASGAVTTGGSTDVTLSGCDIAANSISQSAITANGNGSSVSADCISAVGDVSVNNTYTLACPAPIANSPVTRDPYGGIGSPSSCSSTNTFNQFPNSGSGSTRCYVGSSGGVTVSSNTTLASDTTYVFENTSSNTLTWKINGNKTLSGARVTLYFKGPWDVQMNGTSSLSISAPLSGAYKGIALFGDRNSVVNMDLSGNDDGKIVGAIYSPNKNSQITFTGSNQTYSSGECTQVIGGKVTFTGNSSFTTNCANSGTTAIMAGQTIKIVG